jgi:hypothetical protein
MSDRLERAFAAIDAANADDPFTIEIDGMSRPKEQAHAELMCDWVRRLDPDATDAQLLAARAHHLRRWSIPRTDYPEGRKGYLRWRTTLKKQHADEVATILRDAGYDAEIIERVQAIIQKVGLGSDPQVQTHEDALCLVFLATQLDDTVAKLADDDKAIDVLQKSAKKMSANALELAATLPYSDAGAALLRRALNSG